MPPFLRPEPLLEHDAQPIDASTPPRQAATRLLEGQRLLVTDLYSTGADILAQLDQLLRPPRETEAYDIRQAHQRKHRAASLRLLVGIDGKRIDLNDGRFVDMLDELYPELQRFFLPFVQMQEIHGASSRYRNGAKLAVLGHVLHPWYGTYVPTRTTHLELFGTWLATWKGPRTLAVDVGTGCGVLALMLCRRGFQRVLATDISPNAIESVRRDIARRPEPPPIELEVCDLLGDRSHQADVIVFNPPWTQAPVEGLLDRALHYDDDLFERFFDQALTALAPEGRVVMVFSNIITLVQPDVPHPIEAELEKGRFVLVQKLQRKVKPTWNAAGKRRRTREKVEIWELARAQTQADD